MLAGLILGLEGRTWSVFDPRRQQNTGFKGLKIWFLEEKGDINGKRVTELYGEEEQDASVPPDLESASTLH